MYRLAGSRSTLIRQRQPYETATRGRSIQPIHGQEDRIAALERKYARLVRDDNPCVRKLFGVEIRVYQRSGACWWRVTHWHEDRRSVGPYHTRQEAIRDAARQLYSHPDLKGERRARS